MFNNHFIANCPENVRVKKCWKSVNIWQRCCNFQQIYSKYTC